jgi:RNA polymerase sigma-70 factor (ECF subfamily)
LRLVRVEGEARGEEVAGAVGAGGVPTLDEAYRAYAPYVAAIGLRMLGRPDEVDDLVQDVFVAAHRGWRAIREAEGVKGWLARVTVRVALRRLARRRRWRLLGFGGDFDYGTLPDAGASPEVRALLGRVYRALDALQPKIRVPWTLRYVNGERLDAVALLCGCSLATAKRRIALAHEAVREAVDD